MRLKFSFDDINKLFRYLDKSGNGDLGYEEFSMLLEERWRNIDPYLLMSQNITNSKREPTAVDMEPLNIYDNCPTNQDKLHKLENLARNQVKIPVRDDDFHYENQNINRNDARNLLTQSIKMEPQGDATYTSNNMTDVLKHDYLRRSMEQRV